MTKLVNCILVLAAIVTVYTFFVRKKCGCENPLAALNPNAGKTSVSVDGKTETTGSRLASLFASTTAKSGQSVFKQGNSVVVRGEMSNPVVGVCMNAGKPCYS